MFFGFGSFLGGLTLCFRQKCAISCEGLNRNGIADSTRSATCPRFELVGVRDDLGPGLCDDETAVGGDLLGGALLFRGGEIALVDELQGEVALSVTALQQDGQPHAVPGITRHFVTESCVVLGEESPQVCGQSLRELQQIRLSLVGEPTDEHGGSAAGGRVSAWPPRRTR